MFLKAFLQIPVDLVDVEQILLPVVEWVGQGRQQAQSHRESSLPVKFSVERCPYSITYEVKDREKASNVWIRFLAAYIGCALSLKIIELPLVDLHGVLLNEDDLHLVRNLFISEPPLYPLPVSTEDRQPIKPESLPIVKFVEVEAIVLWPKRVAFGQHLFHHVPLRRLSLHFRWTK